jgi:hypothetical protein
MQPRRGHVVAASLSILVGGVALALTLKSGDVRSPGALLALVLFANAAIRYRLARR